MLLTAAAVITFAMQCGHVDRGVAEAMAGLAKGESGWETTAISKPNRNGTRDFGLYQINELNLAKLGLTRQTALDPCESSRAAATWFSILSDYNTGTKHKGFFNGYVQKQNANYHEIRGAAPREKPRSKPPFIAAHPTAQRYVISRRN